MTGRSDAGAGACVAAAMIGPDAGGVDAGTVDSAGTYPESPGSSVLAHELELLTTRGSSLI